MGWEKAYVTIPEAVVVATTEKAVLVMVDDQEHWIPDSQIGPDSELHTGSDNGDEGKLSITEWIASKKGLDELDEEEIPF
jgi:hypothetical protein